MSEMAEAIRQLIEERGKYYQLYSGNGINNSQSA